MSDEELIRRGDVRELLQQCGLMGTHQSDPLAVMFNEIPAVQPTVKPLRYIEPEGETLDQMRDHARQHPLAQAGDMRLVWVNEGDLHMHTIFHAVQPTVSPDVAELVDDAGLLLDAYKAVLVLKRVMDKHGLTAGASAAENIADRIVAAHPEFPGLCALRGNALATLKKLKEMDND